MRRFANRTLWGLLFALTLVVGDPPTVHAHAQDTPGLYDAECPLERLAAGTPLGAETRWLDVFVPLPLPHPLVVAEATPAFDRLTAPFAPRAPPSLS